MRFRVPCNTLDERTARFSENKRFAGQGEGIDMKPHGGESPHARVLQIYDVDRSGHAVVSSNEVLKEGSVEVKVNGELSIRLTCTPSNIEELVVGRLFTEGFIAGIEDIVSYVVMPGSAEVDVTLRRNDRPGRSFAASTVPSTGKANEVICRYEALESLLSPCDRVPWNADLVFDLCDNFGNDTPLHSLTSGTHSCRLVVDGAIVFVAEDIGRHNALDKAIGAMMLQGIDPRRVVLFSSGRIPVDMVAKAIRARVPVLATKAAPTDQAVQLARAYGLTLLCLVKDGHVRVFSGMESLEGQGAC